MNICVYNGAMRLVGKSGVGSAIKHQKSILMGDGHEVSERIGSETEAVHLNTVFPDSVFAALYARIRGKTIIYYGHSTMEDFRNSFKGSNFFAPVFRAWIKFCYNLGDVILTPTEYSRKLLLSYGIKKPVISVSNGIDIKKYKPDAAKKRAFHQKYHVPEHKKVILSVGHYIERKGILEFIEMAKEMPEAEFFWFGYTNPKLIPKKIQSAIASAPENVTFPGYAAPEELICAYQAGDLFCFMSHEETEGIVVLEALACGIPTLVRDIPVYSDWLKDGENVYKAKNMNEFTDVAKRILNGQLTNLSVNGRKVAEKRDFSYIAEKMNQIYAEYCCKTNRCTIKKKRGEWMYESSDC